MFFSDVEGFSSFAETMAPARSHRPDERLPLGDDGHHRSARRICRQVYRRCHHGVFGAPVQDDHHASQAVLAALACGERLAELNQSAPAFRGHALRHRIGLNSGDALVGNSDRDDASTTPPWATS